MTEQLKKLNLKPAELLYLIRMAQVVARRNRNGRKNLRLLLVLPWKKALSAKQKGSKQQDHLLAVLMTMQSARDHTGQKLTDLKIRLTTASVHNTLNSCRNKEAKTKPWSGALSKSPSKAT